MTTQNRHKHKPTDFRLYSISFNDTLDLLKQRDSRSTFFRVNILFHKFDIFFLKLTHIKPVNKTVFDDVIINRVRLYKDDDSAANEISDVYNIKVESYFSKFIDAYNQVTDLPESNLILNESLIFNVSKIYKRMDQDNVEIIKIPNEANVYVYENMKTKSDYLIAVERRKYFKNTNKVMSFTHYFVLGLKQCS